MLGVLQTWTRDLRYHPHIHFLVPALALTPAAKRWIVGKRDFLVHVKPLGQLFCAKFRAGLAKTPWAREVNARLETVLGGGLPTGGEWGPGLEVPRPLHLPYRPQQQPH